MFHRTKISKQYQIQNSLRSNRKFCFYALNI